MLGKIEGKRRRGQPRMKWLDSITKLMDMNLSKLWEIVKDRETWHTAVYGVAKSRTRLSDWTTTGTRCIFSHKIYAIKYALDVQRRTPVFLKEAWEESHTHSHTHTRNVSFSVVSDSLWHPMDCSSPGSSVHGILQVRLLEWVAISYSRGCSWPRDRTQVSCVSCIGRQNLYNCATWEAICIHICLPSWASSLPHPTPLGHHRALGCAPCAIQ